VEELKISFVKEKKGRLKKGRVKEGSTEGCKGEHTGGSQKKNKTPPHQEPKTGKDKIPLSGITNLNSALI